MPDIVLCTHNARWIHAAFGLRCLRSNLGALREQSVLHEFTLETRAADAAERILAERPRIVGIGVYVWNAQVSRELVAVLKRVAPAVAVVVGGPEVSHECEQQEICALADHVVRGEGDLAFAALAARLLAGDRSAPHLIDAPPPHFDELASPYAEYTDTDIAQRVVYVEASRGCPFTCEFCLSALDVPVRQAPLPAFLADLERLFARGVRHFKFVDRTFNLNLAAARAILAFFRSRLCSGLFVHFEMIPDRFPAALRDEVAAFPPGVLQFEVGIQTFDDEVSARIARRQDVARLEDNLRWLRDATGVHVHADLIVGLPGETMAGFGGGFDRLVALRPHEIQVGILKRLRGAPIVRHDVEFEVVWSDVAPYEVLATRALAFDELQRLKRFARYWDLCANSGRWPTTLPLLLGDAPFARFLAFADWLFATATTTHGIQKHRLARALFDWLTSHGGLAADVAGAALAADYARGDRHDWPEFLRPWAVGTAAPRAPSPWQHRAASRQARHS
jgi:hypothetical protein